MSQKKWIIGVTGASGSIYAFRLAQVLNQENCQVFVVFTETGKQVAQFEKQYENIVEHCDTVFSDKDLFSSIASGSFLVDGMVVAPCSMGTLGKISGGVGGGLLHRTCDVQLKEKRPLIVVPREMPLHRTHLQNMLKLAEVGATIIPPSPHFYQHPQSILDLVDTVVARILDHLKVKHQLSSRWKESE